MVDSFASSAADPDHVVQLQIDEDLRNAQRLNLEFDKAFPEDPAAKVRTLTERVLHRPRPNVLYPKLVAANEPGQWLMPLVRRLGWNDSVARSEARGEAGAAWA